MTFQIGRLTLPDPDSYQPGTNSVTVTGIIADNDDTLSPDQAVFVAEQLAAMGGPGAEQVVPVVCDVFEGFYRVDGVRVTAFDGVRYAQGWTEWEVTLVPVLGHELPVVESIVTWALRDNTAGIVSGDTEKLHAVPGSSEFYEVGADLGTVTYERSVDGGTVLLGNIITSPTVVASWGCQPEDWYEGGCGVDVLVDGEYLSMCAPGSVQDTWVAGNDMAQVRLSASVPQVRFWGNAAWSSWVDIDLAYNPGTPVPHAFTSARVLSLTPEFVSIGLFGRAVEFSTDGDAIARSRGTITLRRGSPWVTFQFSVWTDEVDSAGFGGGAFTTEDGYRYETSATGGWRLVLAHPDFLTADSDAAFDPALKAFGVAGSHTSMTGPQTYLNIHKEWFIVQAERTVIGEQL